MRCKNYKEDCDNATICPCLIYEERGEIFAEAWHDRDNYPAEHEWIIVKDSNGKEYKDHQWIGHAYYEFVCSGNECDGWRTEVDVVSWRYDKNREYI